MNSKWHFDPVNGYSKGSRYISSRYIIRYDQGAKDYTVNCSNEGF